MELNHISGNVILTKFPSLAVLEVVILTTFVAVNDDNSIKITNFLLSDVLAPSHFAVRTDVVPTQGGFSCRRGVLHRFPKAKAMISLSWWRHDMELFQRIGPLWGEFPIMRTFDICFESFLTYVTSPWYIIPPLQHSRTSVLVAQPSGFLMVIRSNVEIIRCKVY